MRGCWANTTPTMSRPCAGWSPTAPSCVRSPAKSSTPATRPPRNTMPRTAQKTRNGRRSTSPGRSSSTTSISGSGSRSSNSTITCCQKSRLNKKINPLAQRARRVRKGREAFLSFASFHVTFAAFALKRSLLLLDLDHGNFALVLLRHLDLNLARIEPGSAVERREHQPWECNHHPNHYELDHDKGDAAPIDLSGGDRGHQPARHSVELLPDWCDATETEEGEPKRGVQERGLHVDAQQHTEPDQIDAEMFRHRPQQRHDDEGELEKIEEERQHENRQINDKEKPDLAAGEAGEQALHPEIAIDAAKHQAEHRRAHQDENHE